MEAFPKLTPLCLQTSFPGTWIKSKGLRLGPRVLLSPRVTFFNHSFMTSLLSLSEPILT